MNDLERSKRPAKRAKPGRPRAKSPAAIIRAARRLSGPAFKRLAEILEDRSAEPRHVLAAARIVFDVAAREPEEKSTDTTAPMEIRVRYTDDPIEGRASTG